MHQRKDYKTKTGEAIEQFLDTKKDIGFSVAEVHEYLNDKGTTSNITTIYRKLDQLVNKNKLIKYKSPNTDSYLYRVPEQNGRCHEHLHLQCSKCGKIIHLNDEFSAELIALFEKEYQFKLELDSSSLSGICADCKVDVNACTSQE